MRLRGTLHTALENFLWWLREIFGDAEYEKYLRRESEQRRAHSKCGAEVCPGLASAEAFYLDRIERQYARVNRCC